MQALIRKLLGTAALPLIIIGFFYLTTPITQEYSGFGFDGRLYAAMSDPDNFPYQWSHHAPWCWRVLTPLLASFLPFTLTTNFLLIGIVSIFINLVLIQSIAESLGFSKLNQNIALLLYAGIFWTVKWSFFYPYYIDAQTQSFMLLAVLLMLKNQFNAALAAILLGVLQKESLIFMVPVAATQLYETSKDKKAAQKYLAIGLILALIPHALVRFLIPAVNEYSPETVLRVTFLTKFSGARFLLALPISIISGLGLLWLPILCVWRESKRFLESHLWLSVMIMLGMLQLFLGWDTARIFLAMLPAVLVLSLNALAIILERDKFAVLLLLLFLFLHFSCGFILSWLGDYRIIMPYMLPDNPPADALLTIATALKRCLLILMFALYWGIAARNLKIRKV
jgi:hypothetical protein